jgi:hypothetical protein
MPPKRRALAKAKRTLNKEDKIDKISAVKTIKKKK